MSKGTLPTHEIHRLREKLNSLIEAHNELKMEDQEVRRGVCHAAELLLRQVGYYRGFIYLPDANARYAEDGTVREVDWPYRRRFL